MGLSACFEVLLVAAPLWPSAPDSFRSTLAVAAALSANASTAAGFAALDAPAAGCDLFEAGDRGGPPVRGRARRVDRRPGHRCVSVKVAAFISRRHGVADGAGGRVGLRCLLLKSWSLRAAARGEPRYVVCSELAQGRVSGKGDGPGQSTPGQLSPAPDLRARPRTGFTLPDVGPCPRPSRDGMPPRPQGAHASKLIPGHRERVQKSRRTAGAYFAMTSTSKFTSSSIARCGKTTHFTVCSINISVTLLEGM